MSCEMASSRARSVMVSCWRCGRAGTCSCSSVLFHVSGMYWGDTMRLRRVSVISDFAGLNAGSTKCGCRKRKRERERERERGGYR